MAIRDKLITAFVAFFLMVVGVTAGTLSWWAAPRDVVDIYDLEPVVVYSDSIIFQGRSVTKREALSFYERSIQCGAARYIVNTLEFVTQPEEERPLSFVIDIPELVPQGVDCRLVIESRHEFNVLFLPKTTTDFFESTEFVIGE